MRSLTVLSLSLLLLSPMALAENAVIKAAAKYVPGVAWRGDSVVTGDFTCRGRKQTAILGINPSGIVVAVFLNGMNRKPYVFRDAQKDPSTVELTTEDLDYDPKEDLGYPLPGFRRSKTCKGLMLDDGEIDPAHLYWNHESKKFDGWSN
jgi:hypothetical protein